MKDAYVLKPAGCVRCRFSVVVGNSEEVCFPTIAACQLEILVWLPNLQAESMNTQIEVEKLLPLIPYCYLDALVPLLFT